MFRHHGMHPIEGVGDDTDNGSSTTAAETPAKEAEKPAQDTADTDWEAKYKETLAHSRKHEQRAKENAAAAKELADRKAAEMTETEKAQAAAKEVTTRAEAAERRAALLQAAVDHGLAKDDLDLLDGIPADQIDERAKKLADRIKTAAPPAGASGTPAGGSGSPATPDTLTGALTAHLSK